MTDDLTVFPQTACIPPDQHHLYVGGVDLVGLAQEYGTPLYVYDEWTLQANCRAYQQALACYPAAASVTYASKAFLCTAVAQLVAEEGLGLDVVSGGELYIALHAGLAPSRIHFHGNNKSRIEIGEALDAGVGRIVVDNLDELEIVARAAAERKIQARVWLRVSPGIDAPTHAYRKTGMLDSKFGLPLKSAEQAIGWALQSPHLALRGLHTHIGSQILDPSPFVTAVDALLALAGRMHSAGFVLHELSPGGGLGVRYTGQDPELTIGSYVSAICHAVEAGCQRHGLQLPHLILEPGRSIVARAGVALYTLGARKTIPGTRTYVSVDGGLADNPRPALYGAEYTALLANKADSPATEPVTIAGKFCESGDILIRDLVLPPIQPGDLLAIPASGAYQLAMSSNYNQALRPAVVMVHDGSVRLVQRRETHADLVRRDLPLVDS